MDIKSIDLTNGWLFSESLTGAELLVSYDHQQGHYTFDFKGREGERVRDPLTRENGEDAILLSIRAKIAGYQLMVDHAGESANEQLRAQKFDAVTKELTDHASRLQQLLDRAECDTKDVHQVGRLESYADQLATLIDKIGESL